MTLVLEDGSGVIGANAYVDAAFVTSYLEARGRDRNSDWHQQSISIQNEKIIQATDYIEQRFRTKFKGQKTYTDLTNARAVLTFTAQPSDGDTVTLGSDTITFRTTATLSTEAAIGTYLSNSISNLITAFNALSTEVTTESLYGQRLLAVAVPTGEDGNGIAATTTVSGASWSFSALQGGNGLCQAQPLSFPRTNLYDLDGIEILGIPLRLKQAVAEYTIRALGADLLADPVTDLSGRVINRKKEKVGPIEEEIEYEGGMSAPNTLGVYPAADQLLKDFISSGGGVYR